MPFKTAKLLDMNHEGDYRKKLIFWRMNDLRALFEFVLQFIGFRLKPFNCKVLQSFFLLRRESR